MKCAEAVVLNGIGLLDKKLLFFPLTLCSYSKIVNLQVHTSSLLKKGLYRRRCLVNLAKVFRIPFLTNKEI